MLRFSHFQQNVSPVRSWELIAYFRFSNESDIVFKLLFAINSPTKSFRYVTMWSHMEPENKKNKQLYYQEFVLYLKDTTSADIHPAQVPLSKSLRPGMMRAFMQTVHTHRLHLVCIKYHLWFWQGNWSGFWISLTGWGKLGSSQLQYEKNTAINW